MRPRLVPKVSNDRVKEELNRNEPARYPNEPARFPIDNEIPDSVNVQANFGPGANLPGAVENENESRQQLNLGNFFVLFFHALVTCGIQVLKRCITPPPGTIINVTDALPKIGF